MVMLVPRLSIRSAPNPNDPKLGSFPKSSFSTREASKIMIFRMNFTAAYLPLKCSEVVRTSSDCHAQSINLLGRLGTTLVEVDSKHKNYLKVCKITLKFLQNWGPCGARTILCFRIIRSCEQQHSAVQNKYRSLDRSIS